MVSSYRAKFDYIVLKPIWLVLLWWAGGSLFNGAWPMVLFYVVMMFALGYVGAALHKTLSFSDLAAGTPSLSDALPLNPTELSDEDSRAVTKACVHVSFMIGVTASVLAIHSHGWVFSILLGVGIWWLGAVVITMLFGLVARQYVVGRLRSIPPGLLLFWLGIFVIVALITLVIRAFSNTGIT